MAYAQIRTQLFALEAKEASKLLGSRLFYIATGGALLFLGYLLLLAGLIPWIATQMEVSEQAVCIVVALIHLIGGGVLLYLAKTTFESPMFEATLKEIEKDQQWLARNVPSKKKKRG